MVETLDSPLECMKLLVSHWWLILKFDFFMSACLILAENTSQSTVWLAFSVEFYMVYMFCFYFQIIQRFVIVDLSNFYFDVAKDRLYVG